MKNGIVRRIVALLLMVVCVIAGTPEVLLTTYADEIQVAETEVLEQPQTETEEKELTEGSESMEQTEIAAENTEIVGQTETLTEENESTEQTEIVANNTENTLQFTRQPD